MATSRLKRLAWFGVSTLILVAMVLFADVNEVLEVFRTAELRYFAFALAFGLSTFLIFAFTWFRCFGMVGEDTGYLRSLRIYLGGEFLNSVTPIGQLGGEPFMAYVIKENSDMKYEEALSTVLSADIINAIPTITFVLGGLLYMIFFGTIQGFLLRTLGLVSAAVLVGSILTYLLWYRATLLERGVVGLFERLTWIIGRGEHYVEVLEERMEGFSRTLDIIGADKSTLLTTALVAHSYFLFAVLSLHFVMKSLSVEASIASLIFVVAFSGVSNFLPTPGGAGAFEATMAFLLTVFMGIDTSVATAGAILFRATGYWPIMIIGYLSLLSLEGRY